MRLPRKPEIGVFLILLGSYAYFWQSRDWNSASRLALTASLVDRGTIAINGLENLTGDRAFFRGRHFTDKLPGFSLVATVPYALATRVLQSPPQPTKQAPATHRGVDYWVALGTSGLATGLAGALLVQLAGSLGCGPRRAALVGLAYGLTTPAYVYATLNYGHQLASCLLLASYVLLRRTDTPRPALASALAGLFASYAAVVELQVGPVSALLGFFVVSQAVTRSRRPGTVADFAVGALLPALLLLGYNQLAFGSPWDMGYFHHATKAFADVHSEANPLGLGRLRPGVAGALLWGRYRGLLFYAPILFLAAPGFVLLLARRAWSDAFMPGLAMLAVFLVNVSYPEWTGGWSTGPRLLVPLLPFGMILVAAALGQGPVRITTCVALGLAVCGFWLMTGFIAVGGRIPTSFDDPLVQVVLPLVSGERLPRGWLDQRFARNLATVFAPSYFDRLSPRVLFLQYVPLLAFQLLAVLAMFGAIRREDGSLFLGKPPAPRVGSD